MEDFDPDLASSQEPVHHGTGGDSALRYSLICRSRILLGVVRRRSGSLLPAIRASALMRHYLLDMLCRIGAVWLAHLKWTLSRGFGQPGFQDWTLASYRI